MTKLYPVKPDFAAKARIRKDDYQRLYAESVKDPEGFWGKIGQRLQWTKTPTQIGTISSDFAEPKTKTPASNQPPL